MALEAAPATHDWTRQRFSFDPINGGRLGRMCTFLREPSPEIGSYLILPNGTATTRYRVLATRRPSDPGDLVFLDVAFDPRPEGGTGGA